MRDDRNTREILQRIERKLDWLRHEVRQFRRDEATENIGEFLMNQAILDKIREANTVSSSTNIAIREVIRLLKAGASDPAKEAEAMELLEAMRADDAAILTENTSAAEEPAPAPEPPFNPSGN